MRPPIRPVLAALLFAASIGSPASLTAQSVLSGSISGTVTDLAGRPVARAGVSLLAIGGGVDVETTTGPEGTFRFALATPGTYEIRVEAIGYQPLVARTLELAGGDIVRVTLELRGAAPPVVAIDTTALRATTTSRVRPGGARFGSLAIDVLPHRFEDLSSVVGLSSQFDEGLGSQGLPSSMTGVIADGLPFNRAPHPLFREEHLPDALFPRPFLGSAQALHNAPDVEWAGAAGGYAAVSTRAGIGEVGAEIDGAWSGGPLWSSSELDLDGTPGLNSFQGSGRAAFDIQPDTTTLLFGAEVFRHEAPLARRVGGPLVSTLEGLDGDLLARLATPSVERISRYSGLGRFYTQPNERSRVFLRGLLSYSERGVDGPGALLSGHRVGLPESSTDFSFAGSFVSEYRPGLTLELRGGVNGSSRTFEPARYRLPPAYLVEAGLPLGGAPGAPAESSRTDAVFQPVMRLDVGEAGHVKLGLTARASRFSMERGEGGEFVYTDAEALRTRRGVARWSSLADATFTAREFGAFGQYDVALGGGLEVSIGGRFDYETIPSAQPTLDTGWQELTGLRNDAYPSSFPELGGHLSISWDPANDGRTRFFTVGSLQSGEVDPRHLFEVFAHDGSPRVTTLAGQGASWLDGAPTGTAPALPALAMLGPDIRPPRSVRASGGVVREVVEGLSVSVSGDFRRTDFLMRRRNLNLAEPFAAESGTTRAVYGTLQKDGALLSATGPEARRFPAYGSVWALDPDGWSEYRAVSAGIDYRGQVLDLFASFTRSETLDNWVGARHASPGAELRPLLPEFVEGWDEARSDFDVPNRARASLVVRPPMLLGTAIGATWRYSSGRPFTPRYRRGVDANGDGSFENDIPFVPQPDELGALLDARSCLANQAGGFARRNSCNGPDHHAVDVRLRVGLGRLGQHQAALFVDALDLLESRDGLIDDALMLVDPDAGLTVTSAGTRVSVPLVVNPGFGEVLLPLSRGRMLRVGVRLGG